MTKWSIKIKLTLEEAFLLFDELNSDSDLEDIYIEPPDVAVISDEDSAEEDEGGLTENLSGRQLRVNVEISREKTRKNAYSDLDSEDEGLANSATKQKVAKRTKTCTKKLKRSWVQDVIKLRNPIFPVAYYTSLRDKSPLEISELFFSGDILPFFLLQNVHAMFSLQITLILK
ncbi:hypothetical protein AVEN_268441-1 [Araneus ventricosus]|uniref:PiggyBac transposable element-derived protein domain-containing protein n=1 Tax=Araneus ventricosus TaxID=182803 RepID=A0A4Y2JGZ4_ARAVE|nr:hypothetical protein AVEN_268441-1 [Araneus ventricosus]